MKQHVEMRETCGLDFYIYIYIYTYIGIYTAGGGELRSSLIPIRAGARRSKKEQREKQDERKEEQKDCWMKAYVQKTALPIFGRQEPKVPCVRDDQVGRCCRGVPSPGPRLIPYHHAASDPSRFLLYSAQLGAPAALLGGVLARANVARDVPLHAGGGRGAPTEQVSCSLCCAVWFKLSLFKPYEDTTME